MLAKIKHPEVLRFFLLSSHYRGPMNYSPEQLEQAEAALKRMYTALRDVPTYGGELYAPSAATAHSMRRWTTTSTRPKRIAVLQGLARELNTARAAGGDPHKARRWPASCARSAACWASCKRARPSSGSARGGAPGRPERCRHRGDASRRASAARKAKNWAESDRIRDELAAAGVILEDKPGGTTTWRRGIARPSN